MTQGPGDIHTTGTTGAGKREAFPRTHEANEKNRHSRNDETNACCLHFVELKLEKSTHDVTANLPKIYQINLKITPPQPDI